MENGGINLNYCKNAGVNTYVMFNSYFDEGDLAKLELQLCIALLKGGNFNLTSRESLMVLVEISI